MTQTNEKLPTKLIAKSFHGISLQFIIYLSYFCATIILRIAVVKLLLLYIPLSNN